VLAEQLDITFQQLQKYENGTNRMSASRLWYASKVLGVPVSNFFEGLDDSADPASEVLGTRAGLEFVRDFDACSKDVRKCASLLCKAIADAIGPTGNQETKFTAEDPR